MVQMRRVLAVVVTVVEVGAAAVAATLTAATGAPTPGPGPQFPRGTLAVTQGERRVTLSVEIAETMETRSYGLMYRRSLPEQAGMLFVFDEDAKWGFWMKNTLIPLSIGFIDKAWRLLEVLDMAVPVDRQTGPWPIYEPSAAYRYALEVNQGFFKKNGFGPGAQFTLTRTR
jgi:uncharacterized membrane protein (UPF0127 family)